MPKRGRRPVSHDPQVVEQLHWQVLERARVKRAKRRAERDRDRWHRQRCRSLLRTRLETSLGDARRLLMGDSLNVVTGEVALAALRELRAIGLVDDMLAYDVVDDQFAGITPRVQWKWVEKHLTRDIRYRGAISESGKRGVPVKRRIIEALKFKCPKCGRDGLFSTTLWWFPSQVKTHGLKRAKCRRCHRAFTGENLKKRGGAVPLMGEIPADYVCPDCGRRSPRVNPRGCWAIRAVAQLGRLVCKKCAKRAST